MKSPKDFARQKAAIKVKDLCKETGDYSFNEQRRFIGKDTRLLIFSTKSSTMFDGESSTNEADS